MCQRIYNENVRGVWTGDLNLPFPQKEAKTNYYQQESPAPIILLTVQTTSLALYK